MVTDLKTALYQNKDGRQSAILKLMIVFFLWPPTGQLDLAACQLLSDLVNLSLSIRQRQRVHVEKTVYFPEQKWPPIGHFAEDHNFKHKGIICVLEVM